MDINYNIITTDTGNDRSCTITAVISSTTTITTDTITPAIMIIGARIGTLTLLIVIVYTQ
jgi:hypothetical protein